MELKQQLEKASEYGKYLETLIVTYETDVFKVVIGVYPNKEDYPMEAYLVVNKNTGVVEYCHSIAHFARGWADAYTKVMNEGGPGVEEASELPDMIN